MDAALPITTSGHGLFLVNFIISGFDHSILRLNIIVYGKHPTKVNVPHLYEAGWKSKFTWVGAVGRDSCQLVTNRYCNTGSPWERKERRDSYMAQEVFIDFHFCNQVAY